MIIQYKKPILIVVVSVIIFITTVAIIHYYNKDNFEWGNVSDWLSSVSTFGTLLVAYGAFIKAPDWLLQKRYEVASHIINETIFNDLPRLSELCSQYKFRYHLINKQLTDHLNEKKQLNDVRFKEDQTQLNNIFTKLFSLAIKMKNDLRTIKRNEFEFTQYTVDIYNKVNDISSKYNTIDSDILYSTFDVLDFSKSNEIDREKLLANIKSIKTNLIELCASFNAFASQIDEDNKSIEEFIIPFKK